MSHLASPVDPPLEALLRQALPSPAVIEDGSAAAVTALACHCELLLWCPASGSRSAPLSTLDLDEPRRCGESRCTPLCSQA